MGHYFMTKSNNSGRRESVPPGGEEEKKMKMNKKLLGSLILGVMLCTPLTGARAADLTGGAIYGTGDSYSSDTSIVRDDGTTLTYDFGGDSALVMNTAGGDDDRANAIFIKGNQKNITINNKLDISLTNNTYGTSLSGIQIFDSAKGKIIDRSKGGKIEILGSQISGAYGAQISIDEGKGSGNGILLGDSDISLNVENPFSRSNIYGLRVKGGTDNYIEMGKGKIQITAEGSGNVSGNAYGAAAFGSNIIRTGDVDIDINLELSGGTISASGLFASGNNSMVGEKGIFTGSGDIRVTAQGTGSGTSSAQGLWTANDGYIEKTGGSITVIAEGEGTLQAVGVYDGGGTINITGSTDITAETIGGKTATSIGLKGLGSGTINYAGGTVTAVTAVQVRGTTININKGTKNKVVLYGNVNNDSASGGKVYLNLNTADSVLNGGVIDANGTFNLEDGAQWNVLGASTVKYFHMKNGIINMATDDDVNIASYSGSGTISFLAEDQAADGVANFENVGDVKIGNAEAGASVTLEIANDKIDTLDIEKTKENLNALAKKIFYDANDGKVTGKAVIREGLITPEARGDLLFDANDQGYVGNIFGGNSTTKTMYAMKNLAATAIVAWRQEDSTLSQRLGELRESTGGQGIWVRMSRGEFEYSGEYKNQYNFFQLGYDWAADNWHYGVAVSHNDGETAYTYGSGENRSTSLSLYGTWLGDAGHYADIVLKQGRLSNDFDVYTISGHTSGDYDAWGTSLSGEYGRKFVLEDDWYVTPQAQLTLMRIGGESYGTNNGISVRQDTLYSAVGRLGFEVGKKVDNKGSVYAKASVLHDFAGNAETYLTYNDIMNSYSQDLSDTWFEAGIGFNYKISDSSYVYADVVRTFGGDVETPWQWNIGMRWSC